VNKSLEDSQTKEGLNTVRFSISARMQNIATENENRLVKGKPK
jgi:hypothetical protein